MSIVNNRPIKNTESSMNIDDDKWNSIFKKNKNEIKDKNKDEKKIKNKTIINYGKI